MVEDDAPHASTPKNREAMYAFFQKHLNNPGNSTDEEVTILNPEEIRVTPGGQVATSLKGETVFSLNLKDVEQKIKVLRASRENTARNVSTVIDAAKTLSGYQEPMEFSASVFTGRIQRDRYCVEKYFITGEGNYAIPFLLMKPEKPNGKTLLYLHPSGKSAEASPGGEMEWFVK